MITTAVVKKEPLAIPSWLATLRIMEIDKIVEEHAVIQNRSVSDLFCDRDEEFGS